MRKAFTLLELVLVIVVIGIISASILPRVNTDRLGEAAHQVVSHIRYTQHLAMSDDKYNSLDVNWYKARWQFIFGSSDSSSRDTGGYEAYTIFSDSSAGSAGKPDFSTVDNTEIARDPANRNKVLSGGYSGTIDWEDPAANKKLNIGYTYGITNMATSGGCSGNRIAFDHMGRPMRGDSSSLVTPYGTTGYRRLITFNDPCILTLTSPEGSVSIKIESETGYACILDANGNCLNN